jgi:hypothetical protein
MAIVPLRASPHYEMLEAVDLWAALHSSTDQRE